MESYLIRFRTWLRSGHWLHMIGCVLMVLVGLYALGRASSGGSNFLPVLMLLVCPLLHLLMMRGMRHDQHDAHDQQAHHQSELRHQGPETRGEH